MKITIQVADDRVLQGFVKAFDGLAETFSALMEGLLPYVHGLGNPPAAGSPVFYRMTPEQEQKHEERRKKHEERRRKQQENAERQNAAEKMLTEFLVDAAQKHLSEEDFEKFRGAMAGMRVGLQDIETCEAFVNALRKANSGIIDDFVNKE